MKNTIKKVGKFIISRALYFTFGIFIAVVISAVYAAVTWPAPKVAPGDSLTAEKWNTFAENLDDLNGRAECYTDFDTCKVGGYSFSANIERYGVCEMNCGDARNGGCSYYPVVTASQCSKSPWGAGSMVHNMGWRVLCCK